jgi:hypothetical protein
MIANAAEPLVDQLTAAMKGEFGIVIGCRKDHEREATKRCFKKAHMVRLAIPDLIADCSVNYLCICAKKEWVKEVQSIISGASGRQFKAATMPLSGGGRSWVILFDD